MLALKGISRRRELLRRLVGAVLLCTLTAGLLVAPAIVSAPSARVAAFDVMVDHAVSQMRDVRDLLEDLARRGVPQALEEIDQLPNLSAAEKESLKQSVRTYDSSLAPVLAGIQRGNAIFDTGDTIDTFVDFYGDYRNLRASALTASERLRIDLERLGLVLRNHGAKVPIIGHALQIYGETTRGLVRALDRLQQAINERLGGHVGIGAPLDYPPNAALQKQYPQLWQSDIYAPQGPNFVFRPVHKPTPLLIWDRASRQWHRVREEASTWNEVEMIYRDTVQFLSRRLTPTELYRLTQAPVFEEIKQRRKTGDDIRKYLDKTWFGDPDFEVILEVHSEAAAAIDLPTHDEHQFQARYALDYRFRAQVWQHLKLTFDGFWQRKRPDLAVIVRRVAINRWNYEPAIPWWCDGDVQWLRPGPSIWMRPASAGGAFRLEYNIVVDQQQTTGQLSLRDVAPESAGTQLRGTAQIVDLKVEPGDAVDRSRHVLKFKVQATAAGKTQVGTQQIPVLYQGEHPCELVFHHWAGFEVLTNFVGDEKPLEWEWPGTKADKPPPELPTEVTVELGGQSREFVVALAPAGRLLLQHKVSSSNPYTAEVGQVDRSLTFVGRRSEPVRDTVQRPPGWVGGAEEVHIYEFRAAADARAPARIVVNVRRPWEKSASIRYTVVVHFAPLAKDLGPL